MDTPLSRSRSGTLVHTSGCRFATNATPWKWADDKTIQEIRRTMKYFGYQTCSACTPLGNEDTGIRV